MNLEERGLLKGYKVPFLASKLLKTEIYAPDRISGIYEEPRGALSQKRVGRTREQLRSNIVWPPLLLLPAESVIFHGGKHAAVRLG